MLRLGLETVALLSAGEDSQIPELASGITIGSSCVARGAGIQTRESTPRMSRYTLDLGRYGVFAVHAAGMHR